MLGMAAIQRCVLGDAYPRTHFCYDFKKQYLKSEPTGDSIEQCMKDLVSATECLNLDSVRVYTILGNLESWFVLLCGEYLWWVVDNTNTTDMYMKYSLDMFKERSWFYTEDMSKHIADTPTIMTDIATGLRKEIRDCQSGYKMGIYSMFDTPII